MTPLKDSSEKGGFQKIEDIVFQFGNSHASVVGTPAIFMETTELLFFECSTWKAEVGDPNHWKACTLASQTLHPPTGSLYREVGGEEFLKQFISQEEEKGLKYPKHFPLQLLMEKEKSFVRGS